MKLMIVESPNKIKKIKGILGSGWDVAASVGHVRDLPVKELGIAMPEYAPQYELTDRGSDVIKRLRGLVAKADEIYLATDPDREGEAISWHLKEALRLKSYHRVTFDAITEAVITRALASPRQINDNLVHAQEARRVLDRLVGYQVSPVLSRQTARRGLSAGRVQSPAVRLVVDREREIEAFVETKHFGAEVSFDKNAWRAQWETQSFLAKGEKYIMDEELAKRAAACRDFTVESAEKKPSLQSPPPPFTTSTLLQAASVTLNLKPDITAQLAQKLFEQGLITYHRTDSQNLSAEATTDVRAFAATKNLPVPKTPRRWKAKGNAQEAHEAIRPTSWKTENAGEDRLQQALYKLIWMRAVASQLADAEYSVNTLKLLADPAPDATVEAEKKPERFLFKAVGRTLLSPGWKALTAKDEAEEDEPGVDGESCGKVPILPVGSKAHAESGRVLNKQTRPPSRYTQASLIKKLESIGIGRPSTYPAILKNILTRLYLEENRKYLVPTELGCVVVDALQARFTFIDYEFTRALEQQLDDIAEGKAGYRDVVSRADEQLQVELKKLHGGGAARFAGNGGSGFSSRYIPLSETPGAPAKKSAPAKDTANTSAKKASAKKAGVEGDAAAEKSEEKAPAVEGPRCPKCKEGVVVSKFDGKFYGCTRYREGCGFTVNGVIAGKTLSEKDVAALCKKGQTAELTGFVSKAGRPFSATLLLNAESKIEFSFNKSTSNYSPKTDSRD